MAKLDPELRCAALALVDTGSTSEEAAAKLRVKKMTVAGWRAARTKGQYADEGTRSSRFRSRSR